MSILLHFLICIMKSINFRGLKALGICSSSLHERAEYPRKYVFAFAFIRGLIILGILRANIKSTLHELSCFPKKSFGAFVDFSGVLCLSIKIFTEEHF